MDISALWEDALRPATNLLFPPPSRTVQTDKFDETPARALSIDARYEGLSQSSHLFLAAWALTLLRYSQTDAVVFGFDDDKSVWPVRITLSTRSTLQQLFSQIADCTSRFDQYSSISDCIPSRTGDDGATKLQKLGSILRLEQQGTARKGSWSPIHNGTRPQCAVILNCRLIMPGKEAELSLAYAEKVLSSGQATWLLGQYIHTLSAIQQHSRDEIISDLDLCPSEDRLQIQRWNGAAVSPVSQCIHEVIQEVARGNPYAPAIEGWDSAFTYGELIDAALKLASQLQAKGVQIETTVPLCFERSAWTVVAILAVLRAGGAFMLLDPHHPEERLKSMIERVDDVRSLGSIVCSQAQLQLCTRLSASVIVVDAVHLAEWPVLLEPLATHVGPENTAMIQHTSGTTGFPKGIEVTHGSYCSSVHAHGAEFGIGPDSRVYQFASYSFDACLSEIVTSLMKGACILIPRETDRTDRLAESITELGANWLVLTPSTLRLLQPQDIPTVETLVVGGERVDQDIMDTWAPHVKLFQVWGPSETGVYATSEHISAGNKDLRSLGCIGRPLGCRIWIVDPAHVGHLAPIGCVGELVVEGPTVARGYVTDPNKENPAFIEACNWSGDIDRNIRAYRTGDFGRYDSDGSIIFVGRKDSQVKYHGQRIELAEIEQNITSQPSVKHCVVLLPRSGPYAESIVAILEFQQTTSRNMFTAFEISKSLKAVKDFASNTMPSHMVPATWLYTPKMLLNMATKIDRATLHREVETLNDRLEDHEDVQGVETKGDNKSTPKPREKLFRQAPTATSDVSKIISESFRRALKRKISPDRSFLGQGGDSISAMRIVGSCRKKGVILTFKDVLTAESLEQLSQLAIGNSDKEEKDMPPANLAKEDAKEESFGHMLKLARSKLPQLFEVDVQQVQGMYPCSPAQEGILLSQAKDSEKYMLSYWFDISPQHAVDLKLSSSRLEAAWNIVVQRHQPFRTVFLELISDHGPFAQLVFQSVAPQFTIHSDPSQLASHIPLCGIGSKTLPHHFRVAVEADKLLCRLDVSHAVMDGISVKLVLGELALACEGRLAVGQTFPYQDYISHIFGLSKTKTMEYWNKYLEGINTCHLKLPQNENQLLPDQRRLESFESPLYISRFSRSLIEKEGVPMASLLQAAWALLLSAYTGQNEVSFAYVVSGRDAPIQGIDSAVGLFINTLICRLSLDPSVSAQEWLRAVRDDYLKSSTHQHASVAGITHKLQSSGGYPFNTLVSIVHHWELPKPPGIRLQYKNLEIDENTEFDMTMTATLSEESFGIRLDYWNNLYSHEHVEKVMQTFQAAVNSLLNPSRPCLGELNLISDADLAQLSLWNKTVPSYVDRCIHEVISKQVKARPKAPAICSWDKSFTHRELDRVTDTFACDLLSRAGGMPADTVVPICMEKSAWAVVAMIAVHKAGGGFVLLDPAHPTARLLEIVNKVSASQIVVSKATVAKSRELGCFMVECSEEAHDSLRRHSKSPPSLLNRAGPHSIAYVVFTSGSTGQPKGVVTEHGAYCSGIYGRTEAILRDENSRHLQYASFNFDVCIEDILTTLMVGGCVCMPSEAERVDDIGGAIRRMSVNSAELTPTVADMIRPEEVPSLKVLILSGEAVTSSSLRKWASSVHVINSYVSD